MRASIHRTILLGLGPALCLWLGCQTTPPPGEGPTGGESAAPGKVATGAGTKTSAPTPSPTTQGRVTPASPALSNRAGEPEQPLPPALPQVSAGRFTPAAWLDGAERVLGLDRRDGARGAWFVAAAGTGWLRIHAADGAVVTEHEVRGAAQVMARLPSAGPVARFAVGRGISRDDRTAPMSVTIYEFDGRSLTSRVVALPSTTRTQVVAIAQAKAAEPMWLTVFASKYQALLMSVASKPDGSYVATRRDSIRVPLGMALGDPDGDGTTDIFIARPYGDAKDQPGDAFRWRSGAERELLPTVRGAREVAVAGSDVLVADGWHKNYGREANALLTRFRWTEGGTWQATRLAHVAGRHGYDTLRFGHIDGDDALDLVAAGNGPAVLISGLAPVDGQVPTLSDAEARDITILPLSKGSSERRMDVIIAGPRPGIWRLDD